MQSIAIRPKERPTNEPSGQRRKRGARRKRYRGSAVSTSSCHPGGTCSSSAQDTRRMCPSMSRGRMRRDESIRLAGPSPAHGFGTRRCADVAHSADPGDAGALSRGIQCRRCQCDLPTVRIRHALRLSRLSGARLRQHLRSAASIVRRQPQAVHLQLRRQGSPRLRRPCHGAPSGRWIFASRARQRFQIPEPSPASIKAQACAPGPNCSRRSAARR